MIFAAGDQDVGCQLKDLAAGPEIYTIDLLPHLNHNEVKNPRKTYASCEVEKDSLIRI